MSADAAQPGLIIGVLLAAGRASRMGSLKQLLPWPTADGEQPLVAASFDAIASACSQMIIVVGEDPEAIVAALGERLYGVVYSSPDVPMFESIRLGLDAVRGIGPSAAALLHPADHPEVRARTLELLRQVSAEHPGCAVIPEFDARGGHPVLIPPDVIPNVLAWEGEGGLRQYWRDHPDSCRRIPVEDAAVVRDLDIPEQYRAAFEVARRSINPG